MIMRDSTTCGGIKQPSSFNNISSFNNPSSFTEPLEPPDCVKCQKASSAPSASLHGPLHGSAGGHLVDSRPGAEAHSAGGSGRSHKGVGTKEEIIAMGSILDCMTDVMENQNLSYQIPAVDKVCSCSPSYHNCNSGWWFGLLFHRGKGRNYQLYHYQYHYCCHIWTSWWRASLSLALHINPISSLWLGCS